MSEQASPLRNTSSKYQLGHLGESIACCYLKKLNYEILKRNFRLGHCEIDIIGYKEKQLFLVEVKTRLRPFLDQQDLFETIKYPKQRQMQRAQTYFQDPKRYLFPSISWNSVSCQLIGISCLRRSSSQHWTAKISHINDLIWF